MHEWGQALIVRAHEWGQAWFVHDGGIEELDAAYRLANAYLDTVAERAVGARGTPDDLRRPLTDDGEDPVQVLQDLAYDADLGIVASAGPRYFGYVIGGSLPVAPGADWLATSWDQNAAIHDMSPAVAVAEEVAGGWVLDLLGLPGSASVGFVTGAQMANFTCLAAARSELLKDHDVEANGLFGAPPVHVIIGVEAHVTVLAALRMLGLGQDRVTRVPVDANGAIDPDQLPDINGPTIICAQAGNVNTGACDPLDRLAEATRNRPDAWLHVDGAFGLWAAATPTHEHLVKGRERADSWAVDAHKWLNVPYDSAFAIVAHPEAHRRAMGLQAAYLGTDDVRQPNHYAPESSRRARAIPVYAALRQLGRNGIADLIQRNCAQAERMANALKDHLPILNDVMLNQVLAATTPEHIRRIQDDGTCWLGGTTWRGTHALRIACSNWSTTDADIDRSAQAIIDTIATPGTL